MTDRDRPPALEIHPLTLDRWQDFETLFGPRGACGGCWCMLWRLSRKEYDAGKGEGNRRAMHHLVTAGETPGLLAFRDGQAIGWCALAPRERYPALARSRLFKPLDDRPCWSVACLFILRGHRKQGVASELLRAAARYARSQGATLLEGYPIEPKTQGKDVPAAFAWTGIPKAFESAGFRECARPSPTRPIMRLDLTALSEE